MCHLLWYWLPEKRCETISVVSDFTKAELLRIVPCRPEKVRVINNCVSKTFKPVPRRFNGQKPRILQVGTASNKNLIRVAQALRDVSCILIIVGELSGAQKQALEASRIIYFAKSNISEEEMVEVYNQCDMLIFASRCTKVLVCRLLSKRCGSPDRD